jgi:hypothetical protein
MWVFLRNSLQSSTEKNIIRVEKSETSETLKKKKAPEFKK